MATRLAYALGTALVLSHAAAAAQDEIVLRAVAHPPSLVYHEEIAARFMEEHPDIRVEYSAPPGDYAELIQETLRASLTDNPVDLGFFGNFTVPTLIERDLAVRLDDFIAAEENWSELGYSDNLMSVSQYDGIQYGVPFSVTLPVVFYNVDLVQQAGGDPENLPTDWEEVIDLAARIDALDGGTAGLFIRMDDTWMFQSLVFSRGGALMSQDGTHVAFDDRAGEWAVETLHQIGARGNMPALTHGQARQLFAAGNLGILVSSGAVAAGLIEGAGGRFDIAATGFPEITEVSRLPGGGNAAVIVSPDPDKHVAIWEYIRFATGPVGQALMARATGYMPVNSIPETVPELLGDFYAENPVHRAGLAERDRTTKWYAFPGPNGIEIDALMTNALLDVIHGRASPEEAMNEMVQSTQALL